MQSSQDLNAIYEKNKEKNKEKIQFFNFLMYSTKAEISINELQSILYWVGITECFVFFISFCLSCSYWSQLGWLLFLVTHVCRAVVGFFILRYLPKTSTVVEQLKDFENLSIDQVNTEIYNSFKRLLEVNNDKIRKLMIFYWAFTFIDVLVDVILFISLLHTWGDITYNFKNICSLVVLCIMFLCNFSACEWFLSMGTTFPPEMYNVIKTTAFGEIKKLKDMIGEKFPKRQSNNNNVEIQGSANANNNNNNVEYNHPGQP